jgi:membrane associated rhomboid family serine protease
MSKSKIFTDYKWALFISLFIILAYFLQYYSGINLNSILGLKPRKFEGLLGVVFSPFLHGGFDHLLNNLPSFFFLTWALFYFYKSIAKPVLLWGWVSTGLWTWVFAEGGNHVGASGLVYFLVLFLFLSGTFRKARTLMALSLVVIFYHAGIIWGVVPWEKILVDDLWRLNPRQLRSITHISWEGHLMGALSGIVLAIYYKRLGPQKLETPMNDDLKGLEEKYGENYWLPQEKKPVIIRYFFKKKEDELGERDQQAD